MNIMKIKCICPKCKKEYVNEQLVGFYSSFANVAKDFMENNVIKTHCEDCDIRIVEERFLKYFNKDGEYDPKLERYEPKEGEKEFDIYLYFLREINNFFYCTQGGKIEIISKIDRVEKGIKTFILLKGKVDDKEYELFKMDISEYEYSIGDRKNNFDVKLHEEYLDSYAKTIFEYLFEDDCSPYFNKKNTSNIIYKAM